MYTNNENFENRGSRSIEYYENDSYGYSAEDLHEENQDESAFESEATDGMWIEHCALNYSNSPVTALEYDCNLELLWAAYSDGRVSSFAMKFDSTSEEYEQPQRFSSFLASDEPVFQLITLPSCILSVSMTAIHMHSVGGLSLGKFCTAPAGVDEEGNESLFSFTCAAAMRPPGALVTADSVGPTHVVAGTSSNFAYIYDINVQNCDPLFIYDVCSPTVCVRASDLFLAIAGADGKVRLLDSRLRNMQVTHTFDAHTGPLRDLCVQPNGLTMLSCGVSSRPVNPFDPKSPVNVRNCVRLPVLLIDPTNVIITQSHQLNIIVSLEQYVPDPLVKVFDILMQRQLAPMSMSGASPSILRFVPVSSMTSDTVAPAASILLGSSTGVVQVCPASGDMISSQLIYAPMSDRKEVMMAMAVSSSGLVMCLGTSLGAIAQYTLKMPVGSKTKINETPVIVEIPSFTPPAPLLSLSASALVLGSSYMLRPRQSDPTPLASSFYSTPAVRKRRLRLTSARRISEEVIKKTNQQDFIGTVPNIGFRANSMLYGSAANRAYAVCDPRKRLEEAQVKAPLTADIGDNANAGSGATLDASQVLATERQLPSGASAQVKGTTQAANTFEPAASVQLSVPATVRRVHSHRGKLRIKEFNYEALNASPFVGLENTAPNAYTNPILQVFFTLPEVKECALAAQTAVYHHSNATSLWCELGFLFHMMSSVEQYSSAAPVQRVVTPSNFQRTFQQIPESVALGLLDNKDAPPIPSSAVGDASTAAPASKLPASNPVSSIDTQQMSQVFCRFLFQQLHREADLAILAKNRTAGIASAIPPPVVAVPNTIDSVFGYSVATTTTFLQSGTIELGSANKAYSLEVVYPILGKNTNTRNPRPTPSLSSSITPPAVLLCLATNKERMKEKEKGSPSPETTTPAPLQTEQPSSPRAGEESVTATAPAPAALLTEQAPEVPVVEKAESESLQRASLITAPAPGAVPSFASVLWGSYQRETHMRGWCSASETYEPFKQVRSLLSLPKVLTLLCGDTVRDPRDATLSGALGEAQSYGSMHTNFWSQIVDYSHLRAIHGLNIDDSAPGSEQLLKAPWLPVEIELAVYRSHSASTGSVYTQGRERTGSQGQSQPSRGQSSAASRGGGGGKSDKDKLVVSNRMLRIANPGSDTDQEIWSIFDGATDTLASRPASQLPEYGIQSADEGPGLGWEVYRYSLFAAVSHVMTSVAPCASASSAANAATSANPSNTAPSGTSGVTLDGPKHSILHIRRAVPGSNTGKNNGGASKGDWWMFNDFVLQPSDERAAVTFADWRHPSTMFFGREDYQYDSQCKCDDSSASVALANLSLAPSNPVPVAPFRRQIVPSSVLSLPSLSQTPCVRLVASAAQSAKTQTRLREKDREDDQYQPPPLPEKGDLIAFDGEFVSVQAERVVLNAEGQKVIKEEGRMLLARISIISDGGPRGCLAVEPVIRVLVDDYILPSEPVIDYVTRFSGLVPEDLNPSQSRHAVVPYRTAYLKLRYFLDKGCVFVGHGLQKDFETANIFVPPDQVIDTVELWRLPNKRKTSLRFLAAYLLKADIQDEIHDSIEDAKTALQLYRHYEAVCALGPEHLQATLQDLYAYGSRTNWTIGLDKLQN